MHFHILAILVWASLFVIVSRVRQVPGGHMTQWEKHSLCGLSAWVYTWLHTHRLCDPGYNP